MWERKYIYKKNVFCSHFSSLVLKENVRKKIIFHHGRKLLIHKIFFTKNIKKMLETENDALKIFFFLIKYKRESSKNF